MKTKKKNTPQNEPREIKFTKKQDRDLARALKQADWTSKPKNGDKAFGHGIVANMLNERYREKAKYASTPDKPRRELPTFENVVAHSQKTKHTSSTTTVNMGDPTDPTFFD